MEDLFAIQTFGDSDDEEIANKATSREARQQKALSAGENYQACTEEPAWFLHSVLEADPPDTALEDADRICDSAIFAFATRRFSECFEMCRFFFRVPVSTVKQSRLVEMLDIAFLSAIRLGEERVVVDDLFDMSRSHWSSVPALALSAGRLYQIQGRYDDSLAALAIASRVLRGDRVRREIATTLRGLADSPSSCTAGKYDRESARALAEALENGGTRDSPERDLFVLCEMFGLEVDAMFPKSGGRAGEDTVKEVRAL